MKAVNSISGRSVNEADLKNHRKAVERAGSLTAPKANVKISSFNVGDIRCEAIRPVYAHNPRYAILYAHGGGYISGGLGYARVLAAKMAIATGFTTYSYEYRLAPEHPYPAALDDSMEFWTYLTREMYQPDHILAAGDSAGGNLVLCLVQRLLESGFPIPKALLLFSPWTDMTGTADSYENNKELDPILTRQYVTDASKAYIAGAGDPGEARFSPLFGDLKCLPPSLIMAGRNEILLDDSIRLHEGIIDAGGRSILDIEENGWHVYQQMPVPIAKRAMIRLAEYVSGLVYQTESDNGE
ncbi:MAG: alpha/beta hydrolase [Lachnospiraceae bacterium]|nr:alpha/beta hydrolase [Lachnospiraceae bacterium]